MARALRAGPRATRARARSTTSSPAPAPTRASSGSPARWASTRPCRSGSKRWTITDELTRKLNIKISGCPNGCGQHHVGEHRLHGRLDQSRRAHDPGLHPPRRRRVRRRRGEVRHAPEAAPALEAGARGDRALDRPLRGQPPRTARSGTTSSSASARRELEGLVKDLSMPVDFGLETMNQFIDWNRNVPSK